MMHSHLDNTSSVAFLRVFCTVHCIVHDESEAWHLGYGSRR